MAEHDSAARGGIGKLRKISASLPSTLPHLEVDSTVNSRPVVRTVVRSMEGLQTIIEVSFHQELTQPES